jgi:hydrogenase maturation protein HypF
MSAPTGLEARAVRLRITGVVQGVGFRPFVHRLAMRYRLAGWIRNASGDVQVAVEGESGDLDGFLAALPREAPPLARIDRIEAEPEQPEGRSDFEILASAEDSTRRQPLPPDVALCAACERELTEPGNRRYRYPFITCTDCGPRFTVIDGLPYDRERTSMRAFTQCPACLREYRSPGDRRYHSETNSCPACGPRLWFLSADVADVADVPSGTSADALQQAVRLLESGGILAIRGFGGFHLACDATNSSTVEELRRRKQREAKPLAVMVPDLSAAREIADVGEAESELLLSQERPIVLLPLRPGHGLAPGIAPGLACVGLMLPSTPLHHLLLGDVGRPLVMTSGNLSEDPIAIGNEEARLRLGTIADGFLLHDREILSRSDDSVLRHVAGGPIVFRRSRGFAPVPLRIPVVSPVPLLAVGPHLKSTFTLLDGDTAYVSPHIGDLESLESLEHFRGMQAVYRRLFRIEPEAVAHDLHPGYLSTRVATELGVPRLIGVQHHHAHIAAVMAEHGVTTPVLGVAYDGTGYGDDGAVWGAEILLADLTGYRRLAHFRYVPLPGGDLAARRLWRIVLGYCSLNRTARHALAGAFEGVDPAELAMAECQLEAGVNVPRASSMGRLFDAAAAILGVRRVAYYEGQAAMELEALAGSRQASEHPCGIHEDGTGGWEIDPLPLLTTLGVQRIKGYDVGDLAADFHASIAWVTAEVLRRAVEATGISTVALGGGTFQNARLLVSLRRRLEARGLRVLTPRALPPGDGAISYGQAAVGAARLAGTG